MADNDDTLDDLLKTSQRRKKRNTGFLTPPENDDSSSAQNVKGLNPLDLLELPREQRKVINWIARRKQVRFDEIEKGLKIDRKELQATLSVLKKADYLHEALIDGEVYYRVVFRGKISRTARGVPEHLWARVELDNSVFLKENPLFQNLPENLLREIAHGLEEKQYQRNEVILWQGDLNENLFFIKNGLVGITRLSPRTKKANILAYRSQGDIFGEFSLFSEQSTTTATVTAVSEVTLLTMKHKKFADILQQNHSTAIEIMRVLINRWRETSNFTSNTPNLCIVVGLDSGVGGTTIGTALASALVNMTNEKVAYTEHPNVDKLAATMAVPDDQEWIDHAAGYTVYTPQHSASLSMAVRITLTLDQLLGEFDTVVIGVPGRIDESLTNLLEQANQVVLVTSQDTEEIRQRLVEFLDKTIHMKNKQLATVINQVDQSHVAQNENEFVIPNIVGSIEVGKATYEDLPQALRETVKALAIQLKRQHQLRIYLPTVVQIDDEKSIETKDYLPKIIQFLMTRFGNAIQQASEHLSDSDDPVYVIEGNLTQNDMNKYLQDVIDYIESAKKDLHLDLVAMDIDHRLVLI